MMFRAAVAFLALAMPAFAQHGGAHSASFGGRGFSGSAGYSSHTGFSRPVFSPSRSFARPAPPARYGFFAGFRSYGRPGLRTPYNQNRFAPGRPSYDSRAVNASRSFNQDRDRGRNPDRDRFDARRRQFQNWAVNTYPYWPGYPYLFDPNAYNLGLYNWGDSDDSAYDNSQAGSYGPDQADDDPNVPAPLYPPYPNQGYYAPAEQSIAAPTVSEEPLTVIFKSGRAPIKVQNYLMTSRVLTDLDSQHYEQIPLDQIDLAATRRINTAAGLDFQVPGA
jgi:hypothetical protein